MVSNLPACVHKIQVIHTLSPGCNNQKCQNSTTKSIKNVPVITTKIVKRPLLGKNKSPLRVTGLAGAWEVKQNQDMAIEIWLDMEKEGVRAEARKVTGMIPWGFHDLSGFLFVYPEWNRKPLESRKSTTLTAGVENILERVSRQGQSRVISEEAVIIWARDAGSTYQGGQDEIDTGYLFSLLNEISYQMNEGLEEKELKIPEQLEGWRCHLLRRDL